MTTPSSHRDPAARFPQPDHGPRRRRSVPIKRAAATVAASLGLAVLAVGCGAGDHSPGSSASSSRLLAQFAAYSRCMRSHGVSNYPDPTTSGGIGIALPHSFNTNSPAYLAASQKCKALAPVGHPTTGSADNIAAEDRAARCMRSHGLPSFPDPNSQGVFDRSKFDEGSPAFKAAYNACKSVISAAGPLDIRG
jgi:hypothetical protein